MGKLRNKLWINKINNDQIIDFTRMEGGVSSEVYKVKTSNKTYCVKRSLAKLLVKKEWFADKKRLKYEYYWLKHCKKIIPNNIPNIITFSEKKDYLVLEFFDQNKFTTLKHLLFKKKINLNLIKNISKNLFKIHNKSKNTSIKKKFSKNFKNFYDLRLDAYFNEVKRVHPNLKNHINKINRNYIKNSTTLVHGDFSPKNILTDNRSIKFIDAETCNFGDPVFDVVFFNNHLLIKSIIIPEKKNEFLECYKLFFNTYIKLLKGHEKFNFISRCIDMIPIMLIARIDGKSPVEYVKEKKTKNIKF